MYKIATNTPSGVQYCKPVTRTRNLIPFPYKNSSGHIYKPGDTFIQNNMTVHINADSSVLINGTNNSVGDSAYIRLSYTLQIPQGSTVGINGCPVDRSIASVYFSARNAEGKEVAEYCIRAFNNETQFVTLPETGEVVGGIIYIIVSAGATVNNVLFKPMLYIGDTALPFEPYIQRYNIHIKENLINVDEMLTKWLVKNDDGSYTFTRSEAGGADRFSTYSTYGLPVGIYVCSIDGLEATAVSQNDSYISFRITDEDKTEKDVLAVLTSDISAGFIANRIVYIRRPCTSFRLYIQYMFPANESVTFKNLRLYKLA